MEVSMWGVINTLLKNKDIILALNSALYAHGLGNDFGIPIHFYTEDRDIIKSSYIRPILVRDIKEVPVKYINNIKVAEKEYTLIDMEVRKESRDVITEALADYIADKTNDLNKLLIEADKRKVLDLIKEDLEFAEHFYKY